MNINAWRIPAFGIAPQRGGGDSVSESEADRWGVHAGTFRIRESTGKRWGAKWRFWRCSRSGACGAARRAS